MKILNCLVANSNKYRDATNVLESYSFDYSKKLLQYFHNLLAGMKANTSRDPAIAASMEDDGGCDGRAG